MSLVTINFKPDKKDLRTFAIASLIMLPLIALLLHWLKGLAVNWMLCICAVALLIYFLSLIWQQPVRLIYIALQVLTFPIGWAVSLVVMATFYYFVLTPIGLFFRLTGRDPLHRKFDRNAASYWLPHRPPDSVKRYFNQF